MAKGIEILKQPYPYYYNGLNFLDTRHSPQFWSSNQFTFGKKPDQ